MIYPASSKELVEIFNRHKRITTLNAFHLSAVLWLVILVGCSSGNIEPVAAPPGDDGTGALGRLGDWAQHQLLGYWSGFADTETGRLELTPVRIASSHFNLVTILNTTAGVKVEVIPWDSNPQQGLFTVRITLRHPYASDPQYAGFDVRGILITGASQSIGPGLWTAGSTQPRILNPDGYTRWWNPLEFTEPGLFGYTDGLKGNPNNGSYDAQLNAYKLFADGFGEDEADLTVLTIPSVDDDTGRAVFRSAKLSRIYRLKFPVGTSYFNYAVDACWAPPEANPPAVPDDFPPNANSPEAWFVRFDIVQDTLTYNPDTGEKTGNLGVYVSVYDWQGRIKGAISPEVAAVNIYSTDLFGTAVGHATLAYEDGVVALYYADLTSICNQQKLGAHWLGAEVVSSSGKYKQSWQTAPAGAPAAYQLATAGVTQGIVAPELTKKFGIHAWVLCHSDGSFPAASDAEIAEDIQWASEFWTRYGFGFELVEKTFYKSSLYYNLDWMQAEDMFNANHDSTGMINVYYVNTVIGYGGAFCDIPCTFTECKAKETYIVFSATACDGYEEVLAHELGHNIGMIEDLYMLDYLYSCDNIADWHGCVPGYNDFYCTWVDKVMGNLYDWSLPVGSGPEDYFISSKDIEMKTTPINSQGENVAYFHVHFPNNFKDIQ